MNKQLATNAALRSAMSMAAGVVARFMAKHLTTDKARELLGKPNEMAGLKVSSEFTSTLAGGAVSLTVGEILSNIPGIGHNSIMYLQDFCIMVAEEYDDVLKQMGTSSSSSTTPKSGERRDTMITMAIADPTDSTYHHHDCPTLKRKKTTTVGGGRGGQPQQREVDRTDLRSLTVEQAKALTTYAEATCCSGLFRLDEAIAAKEASANAGAGKGAKSKKSFAQIEAEVYAAAQAANDTEMLGLIEDLSALLGCMTNDEERGLNNCDSVEEYRTLARKTKGAKAAVKAKDEDTIKTLKAEIATYLVQLRHDDEVGKAEAVFGAGAFAVRSLWAGLVDYTKQKMEESEKEAEEIQRLINLDNFAFYTRGKARLKDIAAMLGVEEKAVTRPQVIAATTINATTGRTPLQEYLNPPTTT